MNSYDQQAIQMSDAKLREEHIKARSEYYEAKKRMASIEREREKRLEKKRRQVKVKVAALDELINRWQKRTKTAQDKLTNIRSYGGPSPDNGKLELIQKERVRVYEECIKDLAGVLPTNQV